MKPFATLRGKDRDGVVEEEWQLRDSMWYLVGSSYEIPVDRVRPIEASVFDQYADLFDSVTYQEAHPNQGEPPDKSC